MKEIKQKNVKTFPTIFFCMCLYLPSLEINFSYLISFMEAQRKTPSQEHSFFLSSLHPRIELCVDIFSYIYHGFFFPPSCYPKQCPGSIILCMSLFLLLTLLYFFPSLKLIPLQHLNGFFINQLLLGKSFPVLYRIMIFFICQGGY